MPIDYRELIDDWTVVLFAPGFLIHEGTHWVLAWLFGGRPFVCARRVRIPVAIDFETPERMSEKQIQIMGGIVAIYPLATAFFFGVSLPNLGMVDFLILYLLLGASGYSWLDSLATWDPSTWLRWTQRKPISRSD